MSKKNNPAIGGDAMAFVDSLLTQDEISESDLRVALITERVKVRKEQGISSKEPKELSTITSR